MRVPGARLVASDRLLSFGPQGDRPSGRLDQQHEKSPMTEADLPKAGRYSEEPTFLDAYGFRPQ
jgi:hypothetical protein